MQVKCYHIEARFCLSKSNKSAILNLQILLSFFRKAYRNILQMSVNLLTGNFLRDHAAFINNRNRYFIVNGILKCVSVDFRAKLFIGISCRNNITFIFFRFFLHQGRTCECNLHSVRQNSIHIDIQLSILRPMPFINKNKNISAIIAVFLFYCSFKFIDQCSNDRITLLFKQLNQTFAGLGTVRTHLSVNKVIPDLFVQIDTVSYHHKTRLFDHAIRLHTLTQNHFGQHNHSESFSAALCVPNHSISGICAVFQQNTIHAFFYRKVLFIPANFLYIVIVNNEVADQIQQSLRVQQ